MVTFPAAERHRHLTDTKLYCLANRGTRVWTTCLWLLTGSVPGESWTSDQSDTLYRYSTKPHRLKSTHRTKLTLFQGTLMRRTIHHTCFWRAGPCWSRRTGARRSDRCQRWCCRAHNRCPASRRAGSLERSECRSRLLTLEASSLHTDTLHQHHDTITSCVMAGRGDRQRSNCSPTLNFALSESCRKIFCLS